jgi:hypothetical protein
MYFSVKYTLFKKIIYKKYPFPGFLPVLVPGHTPTLLNGLWGIADTP